MLEAHDLTETDPIIDHVAHIADIHFWRVVLNPFRMMNKRFLGNLTVVLRRRHEFVVEHAEPFADAVAATGVNAVILTGDFSSTSLPEEFEMAASFVRGLRNRGLAVHVLPGNHDVYTFESVQRKRFEQHFAEFLPEAGYASLQRLPGGTPLILVPTVCPRHLSASGLVTRETVDKVAALLNECGPRVVVAAHYPVLSKTHGYSSHPLRRLENAEALRDILIASGKKILYVCGHVHRFSFQRDAQSPNVEFLSTGAFFRKSRETGIDGEFAEIGIRENGFTILRHTHRRKWETAEEKLR